MKISFIQACSSGDLIDCTLEFEARGCTVLHDPVEKISRSILATLAGLEDIESGQLLIDGQDYEDYMSHRSLLETFGYVFDEGIMLANLNLRENLLLPWKKRFEGRDPAEFNHELAHWMELFSISTDLTQRPAMVDASERKFLGLIRSVLVQPRLLLIDDPYYIFNKTERARMLHYLTLLKPRQPMLIASGDDDFEGSIADQVINLQS